MLKLIFNNINLIIRRKSFIILSIFLPIFIIIFFSFCFQVENRLKVGVIDKDNTYTSKEVINTIDNLEGIKIIHIKESDVEIFLLTKRIDLAVFINKNFEKNLINSKKDQIIIKSNDDCNLNNIVKYVIQLKCDDLSMISSISKEKFKEVNQDYNDTYTKFSLNDISNKQPTINNSLGILIFILFIISINITNHIKKFNTISKFKLYISEFIVIYIIISLTTLVYYFLYKLLKIDFIMENSINFLLVMMIFNLFIVSFNSFMNCFIKNKYYITFIIIISCMLSGLFWNFNMIDIDLQKVGKFIPIRWAYLWIENIQNSNNLMYDFKYGVNIIILSIIIFIITFFKQKINSELSRGKK